MAARIILRTGDQWLPFRQKVITASELASLFQMNPYASWKKMVESKLQVGLWKDSVYMRAGRIMEPGVVIAVNEALNEDFRLETSGNLNEKVFYTSDECLLGATPDAANVRGELLECKTCSQEKYDSWEHEPPRNYIVQLIAQIICCHAPSTGYLAILSRDFPFKLMVWKYTLKDDLRQRIIEEVNSFWQQILETNDYSPNRELIADLKQEIEAQSELIYG